MGVGAGAKVIPALTSTFDIPPPLSDSPVAICARGGGPEAGGCTEGAWVGSLRVASGCAHLSVSWSTQEHLLSADVCCSQCVAFAGAFAPLTRRI